MRSIHVTIGALLLVCATAVAQSSSSTSRDSNAVARPTIDASRLKPVKGGPAGGRLQRVLAQPGSFITSALDSIRAEKRARRDSLEN